MQTPLQRNVLGQLQRTLADLADADRQIKYKATVPFVHVPIELVQQWKGYAQLLRSQDWFRRLFSLVQLAALTRFDDLVAQTLSLLGKNLDDVPEIQLRRPWQVLMEAARELLASLPGPDQEGCGHD